jgi:hypothetical protein
MSYLKELGRAILVGAVFGGIFAGVAHADGTVSDNSNRARVVETGAGRMALVPDHEGLSQLGLSMETLTGTAVSPEVPGLESVFAVHEDPGAGILLYDGRFRAFVGGSLQTEGELFLSDSEGVGTTFGDLLVSRIEDADGARWMVYDLLHTGGEIFRATSHGMVDLNLASGTLRWNGVELVFTDEFAARLGLDPANRPVVARLFFDTTIEPLDVDPMTVLGVEPAAGGHGPRGTVGPDVFVGDVADDITRWGRVGDITAYSVSTTSCNAGDEPVLWISDTNEHPVIAQNLYRLKDGRFEQIGQSWLKHGFFALSGTYCYPDCEGTDGSALGVHCSDPYSSSLNGSTSRLGPRFEVNASSGYYPYPFTSPPIPPTIGRRLQVHNDTIDPALNPGALYFVEGMYVTQDDAAAGNKGNNASYRQVFFSGTAPTFDMSSNFSFPTVQMEPAINAWRAADPEVVIRRVGSPGPTVDGSFHVAYKVSDNGDGTWHYEFAIQNMDSHRSARSFRIPVGRNVTLTNVGFRDVDYHSGEPYDGTDWLVTQGDDSITWSTLDYSVNPDANALRWGTLYNFRFDADAPPIALPATVGLFRPKEDPSDPDSLQVSVLVPGNDCNANGIEDSQDTLTLLLTPQNDVVAQGGNLFYDIEVTNNEPDPVEGDFWLAIFKPNGDPYSGNPVRLKTGKSLQGGQTITKTGIRQKVPSGTPLGEYQLYLYEGNYPANKYCGSLTFTVTQ